MKYLSILWRVMSPHGICQLMAFIIEESGWYKDHVMPKRTIDCGINTVKLSVEQFLLRKINKYINTPSVKVLQKLFNEPLFPVDIQKHLDQSMRHIKLNLHDKFYTGLFFALFQLFTRTKAHVWDSCPREAALCTQSYIQICTRIFSFLDVLM